MTRGNMLSPLSLLAGFQQFSRAMLAAIRRACSGVGRCCSWYEHDPHSSVPPTSAGHFCQLPPRPCPWPIDKSEAQSATSAHRQFGEDRDDEGGATDREFIPNPRSEDARQREHVMGLARLPAHNDTSLDMTDLCPASHSIDNLASQRIHAASSKVGLIDPKCHGIAFVFRIASEAAGNALVRPVGAFI